MFLEKYKEFKTKLNDGTNYYEKTSVDDNPLFGIRENLKEERNSNLDVDFLKASIEEIDKTIMKFKFIKGYYENKKDQLIDYSIILDNEYKKINSSFSLRGLSFIEMMDENYGFNHVLDFNVDYIKNLKDINTDYVKASDITKSIDHFINYPNKTSMFVNFKNSSAVREIYLEFYTECTISIYGVDEKGNTEALFLNVNSSQKLYVNLNEKKYSKLFITGNTNIKEYFKYLDVFHYSDEQGDKNGFIFRTINRTSKINEIYFVSDSYSTLYAYDEQTYNEVIKNIVKNESDTMAKYVNDRYKIEKNEKIELNNSVSEMYILELLDKNTEKATKIKIYGKESK